MSNRGREPIDTETPGSVGARRLAVHYAVLALVTAGVMAFVFASGATKHAQRQIAGGYDVSAASACLGAKIELAQSGRFVTISNAQSTLSGALKFVNGRLSGAVHCVRGHVAQIDARVSSGVLAGSLGGLPVSAELKRDPPEPGAPKPLAPRSVGGEYQLAPSSTCLGGKIKLTQSGSTVKVVTSKKPRGALIYRAGALAGAISCEHGGRRTLTATAAGRALDLMLTPPATKTVAQSAGSSAINGSPPAPKSPPAVAGTAASTTAGARVPAAADTTAGVGVAPISEHLSATKQRTAENTVVAFFIAVVVVMLFARLCGSLMPRIRQPRVMGEVLAGILLGPTLFGVLAPHLQATIFASDIVPYIGVAANLGLIFYMFLIGLEVDLGQLRGRARMTLVISNTALLVPLMLGMLVALPLYPLLAPEIRFAAFALFVGVSMSITAFPVLARIISERRMLKRPLGALALSAAAVDDVSAWFLIALATAVAGAGSGVAVLETIGWAAVFCLSMAFLVRPIMARAAVAYDEAGRLPGTWITVIFAGVLLSAITTETIGIAVIFGAFVMGLAMPRHAGLSEDVTRRVEDFVLTLLLPLFFAYTGLRTNVALLDSGQLIAITVVLSALAIVGKYGGTLIAASVIRLPWRQSAVLGALMNTRGLTELIVLNLALSLGAISEALFTALVIMALVTTFMAGPLIRLLDPRNAYGEEPEEELAASVRATAVQRRAVPEHSILVAPQSAAALEQLLALAEPLARSEPRRELILARLVRPPRGAGVRGGLQTEARLVSEASDRLQRRRAELLDAGLEARAVALTSADPGRDLTRLCRSEEVDLVLLDGRRPLLGDGVPREEVGTVLNDARCDVAVLVAREGVAVSPGPDRSVMVPFGGADHDWAALELASWIASASGAPLRLLGSAGRREDGRDASGLLASAALVVQQFAGVSAEPILAEPGRDGILAAAAGAGLLLVGLSERWRKEGLGETRRAIARSAPAPIVFVRRGTRPGALAPETEMTRFGWSTAALGKVDFPSGKH
jgi:Kef-type K+ transport system membrane component KefB